MSESSSLHEILSELFDASRKMYFAAVRATPADRRAMFRRWRSEDPSCENTPEAIAFSVAMTALEHRIECPEWAAIAVTAAWRKFESFQVDSIEKAFGVPRHRQCKARRSELLCAAVYNEVRRLQLKGIPLKCNKRTDGALSRVGKQFGYSAAKVEKLMARWKTLCPDADKKPLLASPPAVLPLVSATLAKVLAPEPRKK